MTKREVSGSEAGVVRAILLDCADSYPQDRIEWERDSKRLHQAFVDRGWGFLTLDLASLADFLLAGLEQHRLPDSIHPAFCRRRSKTDLRPRFLHGLWKRIFDERGLLLDHADETAIFLLLTITSVWKKAEIPCSPRRKAEAYKEYFDIEEGLPPAPREWQSGEFSRAKAGSISEFAERGELFGDDPLRALLEDCQRISDRVISELGLFLPEEISGRHGPGAVSDLGRAADKYGFPTWSDRLGSVFPFEQFGTLNESWLLDGSTPTEWPSSEEGASYLTDVPKTQKGPRLIAEEPTANQWMQQGVADVLRERVGSTTLGLAIDFFSQSPSQDACRLASAHGDRATIDLSSASDRLSAKLVGCVFRANVSILKMLAVTRTQYLKQDYSADLPGLVKLRKFASMGSALTFPVQSIVFACLAAGVGYHLHPKASVRWLFRQIRVFGDDIIVPNPWVDPLKAVLAICGLKVNATKSFHSGFFRESCGLYAYKGYDVTPLRVRHPFDDTDGACRASWVKTASNAFLKGLWRTSKHMENVVFQGVKPLACYVGAPQFGLPTFCRGLDPDAIKRWDRATQQTFVVAVAFKRRSQSQRAEYGLNVLTQLGRKVYVDRSTGLRLLSAPRKGDLELLQTSMISGPGLLVRTGVPERLLLA